jgi:hypothetical protein
MITLPGETTIYSSTEAEFVVTSHRIRVDTKRWGQAQVTSIMLEELCSSELKYSSQPVLLVYAVLAFMIGTVLSFLTFWRGESILKVENLQTLLKLIPLCCGGVLVLGLVVLYFVSRRLTLSLSSAGASIVLDALRLGVETTKEIIDTIEAAKNSRYFQSGTGLTLSQLQNNLE